MSLLERVVLALRPRQRMRAAFAEHYHSRGWLEPETVSGRGSTLLRTESIRRELPGLFRELGVRTVLDAGCGDFHWFGSLEVELDGYVGVEVVEELAAISQERFGNEARRFVCLDVTRDDLPQVDLILCRDCLVHLKNRHVRAALRNFRRSGSRYLLATTFTGEHPNEEAPLGGWRPLSLERPPFGLGPPLRTIAEAESVEDSRYLDKSLGLWPLQRP